MNDQKRRKPAMKSEETNENIVTGRNPVMEVLRSGRTPGKQEAEDTKGKEKSCFLHGSILSE